MSKRKKEKKQSARVDNSHAPKNNNKIFLVIFFIAITIIAVSTWNMFRIYNDYRESDELYQSASQNFTTTKPPTLYIPLYKTQDSDTEEGSPTPSENGTEIIAEEPQWYDTLEIDFQGLQEVNPEVKAWIFFENEEISYPVLYSGDNEKYLKKGYNGKNTAAGSIFIDGRNTPDFSDAYTLIYGHNMQNLSMFGRLKYYMRNKEYYPDHMYFQIFTPDRVYRYRIFAYEEVSANDEQIYAIYRNNDDTFQGLVYKICRSSQIEPNLDDAYEKTRITALSTCTTAGKRFIVCGLLVDEHLID